MDEGGVWMGGGGQRECGWMKFGQRESDAQRKNLLPGLSQSRGV